MNLTILRSFVHIAQLGSFTRAAQLLHLTQPTLTKQIQRLEEELGAPLFYRTGRSIKLTEAGRTLLQHSHQILGEWGEVQQSIEEIKKLDRGQCRLAVFPTFIMFVAPNFLVDFARAYPNLNLEIEQSINESPNETLIQGVLRHQFDAGIVVLPVGHPKLVELPLYSEESVLIVSRNHPLYGQGVIAASEVSRYPVIVTSLNVSYRSFLSSVFQNLDIQLQVRHVVHHYPMVFQMARADIGAGFVPLIALEHLDRNDGALSVVRIRPPLQRQLGWIEHRGSIRPPAIEAFFDFLKNHLKNQNFVPCLLDTDQGKPI